MVKHPCSIYMQVHTFVEEAHFHKAFIFKFVFSIYITFATPPTPDPPSILVSSINLFDNFATIINYSCVLMLAIRPRLQSQRQAVKKIIVFSDPNACCMSTQRRSEHLWALKDREMSTDEHTKERWALTSTQRRNEHWWAHKGEMSTDEHTKEKWALMSTQRRDVHQWVHKGEMSTDEHTKERCAPMSTQMRNEHWWAHKGEMCTNEYTKEKWALMSTQRRDVHQWVHKGEMNTDEHTKERCALMSTQWRNLVS